MWLHWAALLICSCHHYLAPSCLRVLLVLGSSSVLRCIARSERRAAISRYTPPIHYPRMLFNYLEAICCLDEAALHLQAAPPPHPPTHHPRVLITTTQKYSPLILSQGSMSTVKCISSIALMLAANAGTETVAKAASFSVKTFLTIRKPKCPAPSLRRRL
jgi:hypothetical protein